MIGSTPFAGKFKGADQSHFLCEILFEAKFMATKAVIARSKRKPKFKSRVVRRCFRCGRKRGYMRDFDLCRICFREFANEGMIPGIKKSSW
jgi:small subunit ribosomal protein S14